MPLVSQLNRRSFQRGCLGAAAGTLAASNAFAIAAVQQKFDFNYMLASCMYGYQYLGEILPEVAKVGASAIDIWPKVHGNQREQLDDLGEEKFAEMLAKHNVKLGCITQYKLGPFGLQEEMRLARRLGCRTIVTGGAGPKDAKGPHLKKAVGDFIEKMKPHLEVAAETGVTIAIENHGNNLINTPDSLKWLIELRPTKNLAVALAPYHLEQDPEKLGELIEALGDGIEMFYAWQHGKGCMQKLPKKQELLQMPGRGDMDFAPIVAALKKIQYSRWTEIFMHPVPRGVPILETAALVTEEINRARTYMNKLAAS
ncbi:MAG: sugar phosphate isomerase/epimerase [Planctomycetota bacterium]|nr:sugar phosphate isomerase/epimerase [Planctomycetota bacterium]